MGAVERVGGVAVERWGVVVEKLESGQLKGGDSGS